MVTWWRKPDGTRILVLDVFHGCDALDDYECFGLELTPELARAYLQLIEQVAGWKATLHDLNHASFYNYDGEYYGREYGQEEGEPVDDDECGAPIWERGDYDSRTEMDRCRVGPDWIGWGAWVKHSDPVIKIETEELGVDDLRGFVAGDDPWPEAVAGPVGMQEG